MRCKVLRICLLMLGFFPWSQVWFRVNELLPVNLQKSLPDGPPEMQSAGAHEGETISLNKKLSFSGEKIYIFLSLQNKVI